MSFSTLKIIPGSHLYEYGEKEGLRDVSNINWYYNENTFEERLKRFNKMKDFLKSRKIDMHVPLN